MIISRITELDLPSTVTHIATDWQIATDLLFNDVILESIEDHDNLTHIVFPDQLDPEVKYYGRARVLLSTGYTEWGNIHVFVAKDINDIAQDYDYPSLVSVPRITTDSNYSNHIPTMFTIYADGFSVIGTGIHTATSWFITDNDDNIIWSSLMDTNNLNSIIFGKQILKENSVYRINAVFHTSSDDSSPVATKTILVNTPDRQIYLLTNLNSLDLGIDNVVNIKYIPYLESVTYEIYHIRDLYLETVLLNTVSKDPLTTFTIPANTLELNEYYILKITPIADGVTLNTKYIVFTTYNATISKADGPTSDSNIVETVPADG